MMGTVKVGLVIPTYRCEKQIGRVVSALAKLPHLQQQITQAWIIDNQSTDNTLSAARAAIDKNQLTRWITAMQNPKNYGLGGTHKVAFQLMEDHKMDWLLILHGDDQAVPAELENFLNAINKFPDLEAALGSRFSLSSRRENYSLTRTIGNLGLNAIVSAATGKWTADLGSGLNAFKVSSFPKTIRESYDDHFAFNCDLLFDTFKRNLKYRYIPITWREADQVSNARNLKVAFKTLNRLWRWKRAQFTGS